MNRTSAIALSVAVAIITYYFPALLGGGASSVASPGAAACKRTGFLGLRCAGAGCVRRGMKCTLSSVGAQAKAPVSTSSADALMRKRSVDSCLAAADIYEAAAEAATDVKGAAELKLQAAHAINCAMRIRGHGNILLLEGTLDTPENKKFWGAHGPRALSLVRAAREAHAPLRADAASAACEMDAFMFASSAKGILRQAVTGAGATFKALAEELVNVYHDWDGGVGHCYLGGFYTVAPWPLGDKRRGKEEMEAAFAFEPRNRRNGYYACLVRYQHEDYAGAVQACEAALSSGRCDGSTTVPDYCAFMTEQIKRLLGLARARVKKGGGK